jgi:hypothetical protein
MRWLDKGSEKYLADEPDKNLLSLERAIRHLGFFYPDKGRESTAPPDFWTSACAKFSLLSGEIESSSEKFSMAFSNLNQSWNSF